MNIFLLLILAIPAQALRRVAIVTGGTRGIGLGISHSLAASKDTDLLLSYNSDKTAAEGERRTGERAKRRIVRSAALTLLASLLSNVG